MYKKKKGMIAASDLPNNLLQLGCKLGLTKKATIIWINLKSYNKKNK
jgi:hypothetical protein